MSTANTNSKLARVYGLNAVELNGENVATQDTSLSVFDVGASTPKFSVVRTPGLYVDTQITQHTNNLIFDTLDGAPYVFYLGGTTTAPTEVCRIDSSGRLLRPGQQMFHARYSNAASWAAGATIIFNDVQANVGGYYNATTGFFTAPYTGLYLFTAHILMSTSTTADTRIAIQKNSAVFGGAQFIRSAAVAGVNTLYGVALITLLSSDTVRVCGVSASTQFYVNADNANYSGFCGYLLG